MSDTNNAELTLSIRLTELLTQIKTAIDALLSLQDIANGVSKEINRDFASIKINIDTSEVRTETHKTTAATEELKAPHKNILII